MDFKSKTAEELLEWLDQEGYSSRVREVFQGSSGR